MKNRIIPLVFLIAFLIRLIALNQSLWLDEATVAQTLKHFDFVQIITKFLPYDFHPPLYYLFMKAWTNLFGYSEIALRMPSVLFSLLTGWVICKICRLRQGFGEPRWAASLFLFNPLIVYYSQEARMYMMTTFFLTAALYYLLRSTHKFFLELSLQSKKNSASSLFLFNLFCILGFWSFYGSIFLIAAFYLWLLLKKQYRIFLYSSFLFLASILLVSPLLYQQLHNAQTATRAVANWKLVLGTANLKNLLLIPIKFTTGRINFHPIFALWTFFIFYFVIRNSLKIRNWKIEIKEKTKILLFLLTIPLVLGFVFSLFTPLLQYFRFLYLITILSLLLGQNEPRRFIWRWIILVGFVLFSLTYLLNSQFHRENWKSLAGALPKNKPVYMIVSSSDPLLYYMPKQEIGDIRKIGEIREKNIIIIPYTADIHGVDYKGKLRVSNYELRGKKSFRELTYEIWSAR